LTYKLSIGDIDFNKTRKNKVRVHSPFNKQNEDGLHSCVTAKTVKAAVMRAGRGERREGFFEDDEEGRRVV
jgi:hypothetical protein